MMRRMIKTALGWAGWELKALPIHRLVQLTRTENISCVLDVGANVGQFATQLRRAGFGGRIVSFEPVPACFRALQSACSADPLWQGHQLALGEVDGTTPINVSVASVFSSILATKSEAKVYDAGSQQLETITIDVRRLDGLATTLALDPARTLLKIDTQGFDLSVLKGAGEMLHRFAAVQTELSFHPIYVGQPSVTEVHSLLVSEGFKLCGLAPGFTDFSTNTLMEADGIYANARKERATV
jgi:FkbM family methyltransferase